MGYIDAAQVKLLAAELEKSGYGRYLLDLVQRSRRRSGDVVKSKTSGTV